MAKKSKRYRSMAKKVTAKEVMELDSAIKLLKEFATTKFDQSVEVSFHLGIDTKQADQAVRGAMSMPAGIGKAVRLAVFAKGDNADKAKAAGADFVGDVDLANKIKEGWMDFDMTLATPDMMGVVGPLGKVLGPRGLMPTPKNGTVTADIATAVKEFKAGKVEYRNDASGNLHVLVGKLSFPPDKLKENIEMCVRTIRAARPNSVKGHFIHSITLSATMSPGLRISVA
jgi:large subunit ribosomal protein L1